MIYESAYDTTVGSLIDTRKLVDPLKKAITMGFSQYKHLDLIVGSSVEPIFIMGLNTAEEKIPAFNHPFILEDNDNTYLFTDIRPYVKKTSHIDVKDTSTYIKVGSEFEYQKVRAILNLGLLETGPKVFDRVTKFSMMVFGAWIAGSIATTYGLTPEERMKVNLVSMYHYLALHTDKVDNHTRTKFIGIITTASPAPLRFVSETIDGINIDSKDIMEFAENIKQAVDNAKIKDLNSGVLLSILGKGWYGTNAVESVGIALEHLPTWHGILYVVTTTRNYKYSMISKTADMLTKVNKKDYIRMMNNILDEYVD